MKISGTKTDKVIEQTDVFRYTDYRSYLKDYYAAKKSANPNFSHRAFAKKARFVSPSLLLLVMQGRRNITPQSLPGFCKALGLDAHERRYFETLVTFNHSADPETKKYYYERLVLTSRKRAGKELRQNQYRYLSEWYCPAIRELVAFPDFSEDPKWICSQLNNKLTRAEARRAVKLLLELDLVKRDETGRLKQTDNHVTTPAEVTHIASFNFHRQMLDMAKESLKRDKSHAREVSGITAALSEVQFKKIKEMVHEFQNKIMNSLEKFGDKSTGVYQINFQIFPLTNFAGGDGHE